ncbi:MULTISPECIES: adenylate/guanylate cyclase domain-containing protein [unclassified Ruegeria]|uniref:adenylate/guanylate cyclase domain-containing protein n=1 Tax=unclassified Ruegeria TaxID=2625375 RepID=UPI0014890B98|nr:MULTISPECIES: adenylate/guanylate cyclase domain-containing protein [unclassified Ruegeria]
MDVDSKFATMIIADIAGSTPLYNAVGDDEAQRLIQLKIDHLRRVLLSFGGVPVGQKGDDVLSFFDDPNAALKAALKLVEPDEETVLQVHVGMHSGPIVIGERGIYGEAVNVTARFATAANPGEACVSEAAAKLLHPEHRSMLKPLGRLSLKGVAEPLPAFSLVDPTSDMIFQTRLPTNFGRSETNWKPHAGLTLHLRYEDSVWWCGDNGELTIGRAPDCDVVLQQPWVSRTHAVLSMKAGKLILTDRSTSGTYVKSEAGREIRLKRESVMLADSGVISPTMPIDESEACLSFEIRGRSQVPQNVA